MARLPFDYAVRNLGRSRSRLAAILVGSTLVVLIMLTAAAFVQGMRGALTLDDAGRNVILLGTGSEASLERSQISATVPSEVAAGVPGLKERLGEPFVSPEVHIALVGRRHPERREELRAVLRGITPAALLVHPRVQIVAGRLPRPGHNELLVGSLAARKLEIPDADLLPGRSLWFEGVEWPIVGRFTAPGTMLQAELWTHLGDLQVASRRDHTLSCVIVTLADADLADLEAWSAMRLDLELTAIPEGVYYDSLRRFYRPIRAMAWATAALMALAGLLGGLNTLYAAFAARTRELGMLQALGFSRQAILLTLIQEATVATGAGAVFGCLLGRLLVHGQAVRFSMGVFALRVDAVALLVGIASGLLVGLIGALPPAVRCLRQPIATALKAV
jgi:putative ABC transport system permease protein